MKKNQPKQNENKKVRLVKVAYPAHARQDYTCYGCAGETPIPKGTWYMKVLLSHDNKMHTFHYCQRCSYALENKLKHTKGDIITIEQGDLRWNRLNSEFRKHWMDLQKNYHACKTEEEEIVCEDTFLKWLRG